MGRGRWLTAPLSLRDLSGFAPWGFVLLATGLGFGDLWAAGTDTGELSTVALAITIATTLFVVSAMGVALHNIIEPGRAWWTRIAVFVLYLVFAIWSVGFGFFWQELSGQVFMRRRLVAVTCDMDSAVGHATGTIVRCSTEFQTGRQPGAKPDHAGAQCQSIGRLDQTGRLPEAWLERNTIFCELAGNNPSHPRESESNPAPAKPIGLWDQRDQGFFEAPFSQSYDR